MLTWIQCASSAIHRRGSTTVAFWMAIACAIVPADARAIFLLDDTRYVVVEGCEEFSCSTDVASPAAPFTAFSDSASLQGSVAAQDTTINPSSMSGSLSIQLDPTGFPELNRAESLFGILFSVDAASSYELTALSTGSGGAPQVSLTDYTTSTVLFTTSSIGEIVDAGDLIADHWYQLWIVAGSTTRGATEGVAFDFRVAAIPEPSTAIMIGLGMLMLTRFRRRTPRCRHRARC